MHRSANQTFDCYKIFIFIHGCLSCSASSTARLTGVYINTCCSFIVVSCGDPGQVTDATRSGDSFNYRDNVTYTCHTGYARTSGANGAITLMCEDDGIWVGQDTCSCKLSNKGEVKI